MLSRAGNIGSCNRLTTIPRNLLYINIVSISSNTVIWLDPDRILPSFLVGKLFISLEIGVVALK